MAALGVVGLAVVAPYALDQIQLAADLATDPHSADGRRHWVEMASAALTLPLIAFVGALRTRGFRLVAWTAGIGTMVFGAASVLPPEQASSPGVAWGAVVLVGGALFIAVAEIEASREAPRILANDDRCTGMTGIRRKPATAFWIPGARRGVGAGQKDTICPDNGRGSYPCDCTASPPANPALEQPNADRWVA